MHTFDARVDTRVFWTAAVVPPVVFWILVEGVAKGAYRGDVGVEALAALSALAFLLPLGALLWTMCSVAAYSIEPGRLVVHRVVGDRAVPLDGLRRLVPGKDGSVRLWFGDRSMIVRTDQPVRCLQALEAAAGARSGLAP